MATILSCFNVGIGRGDHREWEVGRNTLYDEIDNSQSGTRLSN